MRLKDKIALVTGSTGGVGAEIAVRFAEEGAQVALTGWAAERGRDVVEDIRASGGKAIFVASDPRSERSVRDLVARVVAGYGRIDVLVNVAERERAEHPMFWCCRYVIPRMVAAGGGSVVNLSAPPAAPGAVAALARRLAAAHRPRRVRVNTIVAGPADTDSGAARVADLAVYLASAESASLTGRELTPSSGGPPGRLLRPAGQRALWPSSTLTTVPVTNSEAGATR